MKLFQELDSLETINHAALLYNYAKIHDELGKKGLALKELRHA